jgi:hypothetical protein
MQEKAHRRYSSRVRPITPDAVRTEFVFSLVIILLVSVVGISLALQGWRSRIPTFDLLPFIDRAQELVANGSIPDRGGLTSFGSYIPPGIAWLLAAGLLLFDEPRLYEYAATTILYVGTLLGIFLLARNYFGRRCAFLAVGLYAFSELGLHFASSLWPRGHPFFYVWFVYWTLKWAQNGGGRFLLLAIVTWALGMYVFMEIAPALLIVPAMWLLYRPRLKLWAVLVGSGLALVIWYPYLQFEFGRAFADLKSQLLQKRILPANYKDSWCDRDLVLRNVDDTSSRSTKDTQTFDLGESSASTALNLFTFPWSAGNAVADKLLSSNFRRVARIPGAVATILLLELISIAVLAINSSSYAFRRGAIYGLGKRLSVCRVPFGVSLLIAGIVGNEWVIVRWLSSDGIVEATTLTRLRVFQLALMLSGIALLQWRRVAEWLLIAKINPQETENRDNATALVLSLVIPWVLLLVLAESDHEKRFWWLWPLQVIFLAALVSYVPARLKIAWISWLGELALVFLVWTHPFLQSRLDSWRKTGWGGVDADQIQAVDYVAAQLRSEGKNRSAIGYQAFIGGFEAMYNIFDPGYQVGAEFDLLFQSRHRILNTDDCAEGVSPADEYRILQTKPNDPEPDEHPLAFSTEPAFKYYIDVPPDASWKAVTQFGTYRVLRRE